MKAKLDENLPATLAPALSALGHDIDTVPTEGLVGRPDNEVWQAAQRVLRVGLERSGLHGHRVVPRRSPGFLIDALQLRAICEANLQLTIATNGTLTSAGLARSRFDSSCSCSPAGSTGNRRTSSTT